MAEVLSLVGDKCVSISTIGEIGVSSIDSYAESISGGGAVTKTFAVSRNGVHWSKEYNPTLASELLAAYVDAGITARDAVWFRVTFTLVSGAATIDSFTFGVTKDQTYVSNITFSRTIFNRFFTIGFTEAQTPWARAVLEKMYKRVVPMYIDRNENIDIAEDQDFIALWRSISVFFAMFVQYTRVFDDFFNREDLLTEFLKQRGIYLCGDETLDQLQYIATNYYNEHRRRGTDIPNRTWTDAAIDDPATNEINDLCASKSVMSLFLI